ncbi:HD domain-containing protein [Streptomyces sp. NPDC057486]|uniref:HD domain-containing protein n=1 Tax=Streptomyces sp. NPDC057486 TaxID=3346145 RepID=UPI00367737E4
MLGEWLQKRHGWTEKRTGQFTVVVGGHHGVPPEHGQIAALHKHGYLLRTPRPSRAVWRRVQDELLDACTYE